MAAFQSGKGEGGNKICKNIPLRVEASVGHFGKTMLNALASIPAILMEEEMDKYDSVHNQACLETNLSKQSTLVTGPILDSIRVREKSLLNEIKQLQKRKASLFEKLHAMKLHVIVS